MAHRTMIRVLQIVKTTDGARWAAWQTGALARMGVEVHVVLPSATGEAVQLWRDTTAQIHVADLSLPFTHPQVWRTRRREIQQLVRDIAPDLIHSHFVTNTLALRISLGRTHEIPVVFQVPGPLHMEAAWTRRLDLMTGRAQDYWIPSSKYTAQLYRRYGAPPSRVLLGYYGVPLYLVETTRQGSLRGQVGVGSNEVVIGNINNIYAPKRIIGQTIGSKGHEYVIDALALVCKARRDVTGVLVGGQWEGGNAYRERLIRRAQARAPDRIRFVERVGFESVNRLWADYDCAVHLPMSENCGGVIEPLAACVPTVASAVGGLPEVILDRQTGALVPARDPGRAAERIMQMLESPGQAKQQAEVGRQLVLEMFDVERTARQVFEIYEYILGHSRAMPPEYDSVSRVKAFARSENTA